MTDYTFSKFVCFKGRNVISHGIIGDCPAMKWYEKFWPKMECTFFCEYIFKLYFINNRYVVYDDLCEQSNEKGEKDFITFSIEEAIKAYIEIHKKWKSLGLPMQLVQIHVLMEHNPNVIAYRTIKEHEALS